MYRINSLRTIPLFISRNDAKFTTLVKPTASAVGYINKTADNRFIGLSRPTINSFQTVETVFSLVFQSFPTTKVVG